MVSSHKYKSLHGEEAEAADKVKDWQSVIWNGTRACVSLPFSLPSPVIRFYSRQILLDANAPIIPKPFAAATSYRQKKSTYKELHFGCAKQEGISSGAYACDPWKSLTSTCHTQTILKKTNKPLWITNSSRHLLISLTTWIIWTVLLPFSTQPYQTMPPSAFFYPAVLKIERGLHSHKIKFCAISKKQWRDLPSTRLLHAPSISWHRQYLPCPAPNTVSPICGVTLLLSNAAYERKAAHTDRPSRKDLRLVLIPTYQVVVFICPKSDAAGELSRAQAFASGRPSEQEG